MEDTSFVSFVSSCLLEPEREAITSKMNEEEEFTHLHDEGFLDCKSPLYYTTQLSRISMYKWDIMMLCFQVDVWGIWLGFIMQ